MKKSMKKTITSVLVGAGILASVSIAAANSEKLDLIKANAVTFFGSPSSSISSSVAIPQNHNMIYYSGTVPSMINPDGKTPAERYGDTETQAISILEKFKKDLEGKGLSLSDVTYLRVYIVPDPNKGGMTDYQGWFKAYAKYFNTTENPVKTARSTVGVNSLVNPEWLIEIEAEVAYKGQ